MIIVLMIVIHGTVLVELWKGRDAGRAGDRAVIDGRVHGGPAPRGLGCRLEEAVR